MVPGAPPGMTAANWRSHPYAPWAFRNVAAFLPVARVVGADNVAPLPATLAPAMRHLLVADDDGVPRDLPAILRATHADAFIVVASGRTIYEHYAPGMGPAASHLGFSVTKAIVGLVAELLIAGRAIDASARAAAIVPELAGTSFADATLRALLDMTDGVAFDEDYADPAAQIHDYSRHFWGDGAGGTLAALRRLPAGIPTPACFAYRTPATDVAGLMLERGTGRPLDRLLADHVWIAAGAGSAVWVRDTGGRVIASAGLSCAVGDLARVGRWLATAPPGTPRAAALASIAAGGNRALFAAGDQPTRPGFSYRSGWWIDHPSGAINALGVFGQRLHVVPGDDLIIARFGSHPVAGNAATDGVHARLFAAIRAAVREDHAGRQ